MIFLCLLVLASFLCSLQLYRATRYQRRVLQWVDGREAPMGQLVTAAQAARSGRMVSPQSSFRDFFQGGMLTKQGVENAGALLEQHEALIKVNREITQEITVSLGALTTYEARNPLPKKPRWL